MADDLEALVENKVTLQSFWKERKEHSKSVEAREKCEQKLEQCLDRLFSQKRLVVCQRDHITGLEMFLQSKPEWNGKIVLEGTHGAKERLAPELTAALEGTGIEWK